jgi:cAMP-specific phosphodiesterase 4
MTDYGNDTTHSTPPAQMSLKVADLGHICSPLAIHKNWVSALEEEMFRQGDAEKSLSVPVSPLCDRDKGGITQSQVGFFRVVVLPLLEVYASHFPAAQPLLSAAQSNCAYWAACEAAAA